MNINYVAPEMEVIEIVSEGVLCQSGFGGGDFGTDDWEFGDGIDF